MPREIKEVILIAKQAGMILSEGFGKPHDVRQKGVQDPVTEIDKKSEDFILDQLRKFAPGDKVVTEETGVHDGNLDHVWYIDPLDGTMNYAHNIPYFCVSIAYAAYGKLQMGVIYDPMRRECFYAQKGAGAFCNDRPIRVSTQTELPEALLATGFNMRVVDMGRNNFPVFNHFMLKTAGVRRMGSAALEMAYLAAGRLDGMWEMKLMPWDVAAGIVIGEESGAKISALSGKDDCFNEPFDFLMANQTLHTKLLADIQKIMKDSEPTNENR